MSAPAVIPSPPTVAGSVALHQDHRADLEKSGLTDDTIRATGVHSARPGDLPRLCGRPIPEGTSGLVFPYGEDFCRVKLFPPLPGSEGKPIKYLQPSGSPVRAYVPMDVRPVLPDPSRLLFITEGEKKALALTQAGCPCVGLGGVWNFRTRDLPDDAMIPDLEAVAWSGRIAYLVPDADAWTNENVLCAVYRLARLLEARGATILIVKLPSLDGHKTGVDDFLVARGDAAFRRLVEQAVTLRHSAFKPWREQEKAKTRKAGKAAGPLPDELIGRRIHPALHFESDGFAAVGIVTIDATGTDSTEIVTSTRERFPTEAIGPALAGRPFAYADLVNRWRPEDVTRFLDGEDEPPTFERAVAQIWDRLDSLLELGRDSETVALAAWAVATYFFPIFLAFPRLDLRGERGSGKSKALSILAAACFNGLLRVSPTTAVLFRLAEPLRPTFLMDEIEGLAGDEKREILSIINAGYKAGGRVDRCEGDDRVVRSWSIYTPLAMAGIAGVNRVTEDRSITLVLTRGRDLTRLNAEVDPADPRFASIRDLCIRLALTRSQEVRDANQALVLPDWLVGRERELWRPLLTIATLADREAGDLNLVSDLLTIAREQGQDRAGLSDESEALVSVLDDKLVGASEMIVSPGDLCEELRAALRWKDAPRPETVGRWLKRLKIPKAPRSAEGVRYIVTAAGLAEIRARAGSGAGEPTLGGNPTPATN
jgi:hypothetical protein